MSVRIMSVAWTIPLPTTSAKLLLLALADNADDTGKCWPSVKLLAEKCGLSTRAVRGLLADLERLHHIRVERRFRDDGSQASNLYFILTSSTPAESTSPPRTPTSGPGGSAGPRGEDATSRPLNHQLKSSEESPQQQLPGGREFIEFKFPSALSEADRVEAAKRLQVIGQEQGQQVLDELTGRGQLQPVKNPMRYLRTLMERAQAGTFTPDLANKVKEDRDTRDRHLAAMQRREQELQAKRPPIDMEKLSPRLQAILRKHVRPAAIDPAAQPQQQSRP